MTDKQTAICLSVITFRAWPGRSARLESLEPQCEPIPVRAILRPRWQMDGLAIEPLQRLQHRPVALAQQPFGDVQAVIRVDADKVRIEGSVMNFRERNAVGNDRLAEQLMPVRDDMSCIEQ